MIWTDVIQPQSINGNTDICCLIKYDYGGYRNPCDMQMWAFVTGIVWVCCGRWGTSVGLMAGRVDLGMTLHVYQPPMWCKLSLNCLSISSPQGETPQHPPAGRCLRDPERVLPLPWAVSPEISLWGNSSLLYSEECNDFSSWYFLSSQHPSKTNSAYSFEIVYLTKLNLTKKFNIYAY